MNAQNTLNQSGESAENRLLVTRHDYARRTSFSLRKLDELIKEGVIPAIRFSKKCLRIPVAEADKALLRLTVGGGR